MHRFALRLAVLAFVLVNASSAEAQTVDAKNTTVTQGALDAARELLELTRAEEVMRATMEATFDAQVEQQPLMAPFRETMQAWANKHMTWANVGPRMTRIYAEAFTEDELRQLVAFYRTPLGQKLARVTPELGRKGTEIGAQIAAEHMTELQEMIQKRAAELQGQRPPDSR